MQKHNPHFKLLIFRINLLFGISNEMSTYGNLSLLLMYGIYLVFSSLEIQRRLIQTKLYYHFLLLCLKRNVSQTFKSSNCNKLFAKFLCYWYSLLWWMFFILCDNWKKFFIKIYHYPELFCNRHVIAFFEASALRSRILCPLSLQYH